MLRDLTRQADCHRNSGRMSTQTLQGLGLEVYLFSDQTLHHSKSSALSGAAAQRSNPVYWLFVRVELCLANFCT